MRKSWRATLLALGSSLALLMSFVLTADPASAQPEQCYDGCFLANLWDGGLVINGLVHNDPLFTYPLSYDEADGYIFASVGHGTFGTLKAVANGLCWNAVSKTDISLDSCPSGDTNEWFSFTQHGNYWLIYSYRFNEWVAADGNANGGDLYVTTGENDTSFWYSWEGG
jgi:hypothetical protein